MHHKGPMSEESATSVLPIVQKQDEAEGFCPLTQDVCRKDCVCYQHPYKTPSGGRWYVYGGHCGNAMFNNECCAR